LFRAFAQLKANPQPHLWLAGKELDSEYTETMQRLTQDLEIANRVHFLGHITDIPALLAEANIFSLTSQSIGEGCPIAMLEAMSCAKACVGSDIPGIRDQIVNETSGLLVPAEEPEALASALQRLVDHPELRIRFGDNARLRVQNHFSIEVESSRYQTLYLETLNLN